MMELIKANTFVPLVAAAAVEQVEFRIAGNFSSERIFCVFAIKGFTVSLFLFLFVSSYRFMDV
jgi:hypothetical protein